MLPGTILLQLTEVDVQKIVVGVAKDMKRKMADDFNEEIEKIKEKVKDAIETGATKLLSSSIKKLLGTANVWYVLFKTVFKLVDKGFGISKYFETIDTYNMITYLSAALMAGYYKRSNAFLNNEMTVILNNTSTITYSKGNKEALAKDAMYLLKAVCNTRLLGEQAFKTAVGANNVTLLHGDSEYDYGILEAANAKFGTSYKTIEELYDYIYGNILKARDAIFNVEIKTDVDKPAAPSVTFNYDTMTTNEAFDDSYEYCLSNGEWKPCTGNSIAVKLKTNSTVLRVRKASGNGRVAGEITTLTLYAKREFSKVVTVKFDDGKYYFTNLLSTYKYQITPVDSANATVDWTHSKTFDGSPSAVVNYIYGKYLAIRTCANDELKETVSQTRIIPVAVKQPLTINVWGNGEVQQSDQNGRYFIGDNIQLTALPAEGAIFKGWYVDGDLVSRDPEYILEMYNYAEVTAKYEGGEIVEAEDVELVLTEMADVEAPARMSSKAKNMLVETTRVFAGTVAKLSANVYPLNTTDKSLTWSSSNDEIASVNQNGVIRFLASGNVTITATLENGVSSSYSFNVLANDIVDFYIAEEPIKVEYYENEELDLTGLKAVARFADGRTEEITDYIVGGYTTQSGQKDITLAYAGKEATFPITTVHKTQWIETTVSTCNVPGVESEICKLCGETVRTRALPTIDHHFEWVVKVPATETEKGLKEYTCSACGTVFDSAEFDWCDHSYIAVVTEPTCETQGYTTYTCEKCGDSYIDNFTDALDHDYTVIVVEPKCEKAGYTLSGCNNCGDVQVTDQTEPLEHNYVTESVEATCAAEGGIRHTCTLCGDTYMTDTTEKTAHVYTATSHEATCEEGGYTLYTCDVCGDTYKTDETPALEHQYTSEAVDGNCEEGIYILYTCSVCGDTYKDVITEPGQHEFGGWLVNRTSDEGHAGVKYKLCVKCGYQQTAPIPVADHEHIAGEWEIESEAACEVYGVKVQKCTECGELMATEVIEAPGHVMETNTISATCTEDGYTEHRCSVCGYSYKENIQPANGHVLGEWEVKTPATCTEDGLRSISCQICGEDMESEVLPATGHLHTESEVISVENCTEIGVTKVKCTDCGEYIDTIITPPLGHKYEKHVLSATCEEAGYVEYVCTVCGHSYVDETALAYGHDFGDWEVQTEPTCTQDGLKIRHCTKCDAFEEELIPVSGHDYQAVTTEPTCTFDGKTVYTCSKCGDTYEEIIAAYGHVDEDGDGWCDVCDYEIYHHDSSSEPVEGDACPYCEKVHEGFAGKIVQFFHMILYRLKNLFGNSTVHLHQYRKVVTEPTCTEPGYTTYICSVCGKSYVDDETEALGHNFGEWIVDVKSTCQTEGHQYRTCERCSEIEEETLPLTTHVDENADGFCDICGIDNVCAYCGKVHDGALDDIVSVLHKLLYRLTHLFVQQ